MGHSGRVLLSKLPGNAKHRVSADSRGHSRLHNPAPNRKPVGLSGPLRVLHSLWVSMVFKAFSKPLSYAVVSVKLGNQANPASEVI